MYYYGILPEFPEVKIETITNYELRIMNEERNEIADLLSSFSGQAIDGSFFGLKEDIVLPVFDRVEIAKRGKITEIEAIGDESWLVHFSENPEPVGGEQVEYLRQETKRKGYKGWFISKQGFTYEAILKAEGEVCLSIDEDIKAIKRVVCV